MEIKIDTKKDSPEEIQKMIDFLATFVSSTSQLSNTPTETASTQPSEPSPAMFNMFGSDSPPSMSEIPEEDQKQESEDTDIKIVPY